MIVAENEAKAILAGYGLRTPSGRVAETPFEAATIAAGMRGQAVVKALIPTGGRGRAGGVRVCRSVEQVWEAASELLGRTLLGCSVEKVLVEEAVPICREIYAGVVVNTATGQIDLIVSLAGGVDVEEAVQVGRQATLRTRVDPGDILPVHRVRKWLEQADPEQVDQASLSDVLVKLYRAAADLDAMLLEVNPLAVAEDRSLVVLDCKLEVDDSALYRQPELEKAYRASLTDRELRAKELGVSYVPLEGDVGVITSGAGLGMATLDMLKQTGLSPADFLDTGGSISERMVQGAMELVLEPPEVRGAIINLYGGINRMVEASRGIVAALRRTGSDRPIVVKILGNQQEEAWAMLEKEPGVHVIRVVQTEAAVAELARLLD